MFSDRDIQRLDDIVDNADAIASYLAGLTFDQFAGDRKTVDATERCIERAIEASIQLGPEKMAQVLETFPAAEVRGMGNRLRHEYGSVNSKLVWNTATQDVPLLREACVLMIARLPHGR